jgi:hypothetical protein
LKRIILLLTVVAVTSVMLSVSAPLAFAVPDEHKAELKSLCKTIDELTPVIAVDPVTLEPLDITFTDQGECIEYVNAGGEIVGAATP